MAGIGAAARLFFLDEGHWPKTLKDLTDEGRFLIPGVDPWGNQYQLRSSATRITVLCLGADGSEGGDGINADIIGRRRRDNVEFDETEGPKGTQASNVKVV